jgi:PAS domain S-box-containing protein
MWPAFLRSPFEPQGPALEQTDPSERLSARLVLALVDLLLVATIAFATLTLAVPVPPPAAYRVTLPAAVALLFGLRWLVRRGKVGLAAMILCAGGWVIIASDLQIHGPHTVAVGAFLLMVIIGGFTLGPLAAFSLAAATVALLALVIFRGGQTSALVAPGPWTRWIHYTTQLVLGSVLVAWWAKGMRRVVRQLRESEARHAQLLENSPDATVCIDRDGVITFWNTAAEAMLGYPRATLLSRPWDSVPTLPKKADHIDRARSNVARAMGGEEAPAHELDLVHRDGHTVTVEVRSVPLQRDGRVAGVISTLRDISARKEAERERAALEEQLVNAHRLEAIGRFAGGVVHDFNNILTIIFNAAEVIRAKATDEDDGAIRDVLEAATRGASLAKQLLAFSRQQPSEARPTDVRAAIVALRPMLARLLGEAVSIEIDLEARGPLVVRIGPGQIDQVLLNLAINSRDAMPGGGVIRLTVTAPYERGGASQPTLEMVFADTGCGMDAPTIAQAFDPFFSTKGEQGTGLGLSIVNRIVRQAGGTIRCESEPRHGTTFRIALPLMLQASLAEGAKATGAGPPLGQRVVLVDDDPLVRVTVARALEGAGVVVDSIAPPLIVADIEARLLHACALITDVVMPDMTGPDLVDELRRRGCRTPVVFVSGHAEHALLARIRNTPDACLLQKPFRSEDILARIDELARARRAEPLQE